jgi:hypothetical protein
MTPAAREVWLAILFELLIMQQDIRDSQRHTTGTMHNI